MSGEKDRNWNTVVIGIAYVALLAAVLVVLGACLIVYEPLAHVAP